MQKVTDANFNLPIIYPTEIVGELTSGANCPVHIRGLDTETKKKNEYVVKLRDAERMRDPAAALRELLAAYIAIEMDIPVAEPVIIGITPEVADLTLNNRVKQRFLNSTGLNFGTLHLGLGFQVFVLLASFPPKLEQQAQQLLAFDLLVQNPDRTKEKPNMLTDGTHLVGIDHELSFSFASILFGPVELWLLSGEMRKWIDNLVLLPRVKGLEFDFDDFENRLIRLNEHFWDRAEANLPVEWRHESLEKIRNKLLYFVEHRAEFINELKIILS